MVSQLQPEAPTPFLPSPACPLPLCHVSLTFLLEVLLAIKTDETCTQLLSQAPGPHLIVSPGAGGQGPREPEGWPWKLFPSIGEVAGGMQHLGGVVGCVHLHPPGCLVQGARPSRQRHRRPPEVWLQTLV